VIVKALLLAVTDDWGPLAVKSISSLPTGEYRRRHDCRGCHGTALVSFLDYGRVPLAGDFLLPEEVGTESLYPMDLAFCPDCSLTQISNVVPAEELFTDYRYLSSVTSTLMGHFREYAQLLAKEFLRPDDNLLVEFGCNDGVLLQPLTELGIDAIGIDAAENVVQIARAKGLDVWHGFFGADLGALLRRDHGPATVITSSNCFAHIDDLDNILRGVDALLADDGILAVEVHYVLDLLETVQFETVYHEHLCYYSLKALSCLYNRFGFEVFDAQRLPMHGGAIRVFAKRQSNTSREPTTRLRRMLAEEESKSLYELPAYQQFGASAVEARDAIRRFVLGRKAMGKSLSAYGAAGRATTLLNYCGLDHSVLDYVVDESPSRIGRFVPGVQIPIVPRSHFHEQPTDDCLLTAWNYRNEIVAKESAYLANGGVFLAPLPRIEVIEQGRQCRASA
jgi:SAM-dependent methyltransferase